MKKWFRIHLSTALILSLLAWPLLAGFLYLSRSTEQTTPLVTATGVGVLSYDWGWPLRCCTTFDPALLPPDWNYSALAIDVLIPLAVLWAISRVCEFRIARYERRLENSRQPTP